jgi:hypothetical protein
MKIENQIKEALSKEKFAVCRDLTDEFVQKGRGGRLEQFYCNTAMSEKKTII